MPDRGARAPVEPRRLVRALEDEEIVAGGRDAPCAGEAGGHASLGRTGPSVHAVEAVVDSQRPQHRVRECEELGLRGRVGEPDASAGRRVEAERALSADGPGDVAGREQAHRGERPPGGGAERGAGEDAVRPRIDARQPPRVAVDGPQLVADGLGIDERRAPDGDAGEHRARAGIDAHQRPGHGIGDPDRPEGGEDPLRVRGQLELGDHRRRRGQRGRIVAPQPERRGRRREHEHHGAQRERGHRRPRPERPRGRAAARFALRRVTQLEPEPGHEVVGHAPILRRTAARPRLTRLRTTDSDVSSVRAISS